MMAAQASNVEEIRRLLLAGRARLEEKDWYRSYAAAGFIRPPVSDRTFCDRFDFSSGDFEQLRLLILELFNMGVDLKNSGFFAEAALCLEQVTCFAPELLNAQYILAEVLLSMRRFKDAVAPLVAWAGLTLTSLGAGIPQWAGEPLAGKSILIIGGSALGDIIQFSRFLGRIDPHCVKIFFHVRPSLWAVLGPIPRVEMTWDALPAADYICSVFVLPHLIGLETATLAREVPYLRVEPARIARWAAKLPGEGFRIGIAWQKGFAPTMPDQGRNIPLACFAPLARLPGVRLISLQLNDELGELQRLPEGMAVATLGAEFNAGPDGVLDDLAVMASLDLIVSCDTSVAHIAGAFGRPVWVLLKEVADWRWSAGEEESPWYPSMRLFRQRRAGDWDELMTRTAAALAPLVEAKLAPKEKSTMLAVSGDPLLALMASTLMGNGQMLANRGFVGEALGLLQKAVQLAPSSIDAVDALAVACFERSVGFEAEGDLVAAEEMLRKALALREGFPAARQKLASLLVERGRCLFDEGYRSRALSMIYDALVLKPGNPSARTMLEEVGAGADELGGPLAREEARLRAALARSPGEVSLTRDLAVNLFNQAVPWLTDGNFHEAAATLRKALALVPDFSHAGNALALALYQIAVLLYNQRRFGEAEAAAWEALSRKPAFDEAIRLLDLSARHPARTLSSLNDPRLTAPVVELLEALRVKDVVGIRYVRKGGRGDGGYVMTDVALQDRPAYSLGIGSDVSWDRDMAETGCQLFQYDHTVASLPETHPNFHWSKIGISATPSADPLWRSIDQLIETNGHGGRDDLILKIDVEGSEWAIFAEMSDETLCRFSQIVGEFHNLPRIVDPYWGPIMFSALRKINRHFQLVHLHANNGSAPSVIGGVGLYNDLELTYLRRKDYKFIKTKRMFPTELDFPCNPNEAEFLIRALGH